MQVSGTFIAGALDNIIAENTAFATIGWGQKNKIWTWSHNGFIAWWRDNTIQFDALNGFIAGYNNSILKGSDNSFVAWRNATSKKPNTFVRNSDASGFTSSRLNTFLINAPFAWVDAKSDGIHTGWVGINTNDPHADLEVNSTIRWTPRATDPMECAPGNEGTTYYNSGDKTFYRCDGTAWVTFSTGGSWTVGTGTSLWSMSGTTNNMYNNNRSTGFVGVGLQSPTVRLQVNGSVIAGSLLNSLVNATEWFIAWGYDNHIYNMVYGFIGGWVENMIWTWSSNSFIAWWNSNEITNTSPNGFIAGSNNQITNSYRSFVAWLNGVISGNNNTFLWNSATIGYSSARSQTFIVNAPYTYSGTSHIGWVGINTNDPHADLEVNSTIRWTPRTNDPTTCKPTNEWTTYYNSNDKTFYRCDGADWVTFPVGGTWTVGTGTSLWSMYEFGNSMYNNNWTGLVGIGLQTPQAKLQVFGNIIVGGTGNTLWNQSDMSSNILWGDRNHIENTFAGPSSDERLYSNILWWFHNIIQSITAYQINSLLAWWYSNIVWGSYNKIYNTDYGFIWGGSGNRIGLGMYDVEEYRIVHAYNNIVWWQNNQIYTVLSWFDNNTTGVSYSNIIGWWSNSILWGQTREDADKGSYSSIVWWIENTIDTSNKGFIWWGNNNNIYSGNDNHIGWGSGNNIVNANRWSIWGWQSNTISSAINGFIGWWYNNTINAGENGFVAGRSATLTHSNTFIWNSSSLGFASAKGNTFLVNVPFSGNTLKGWAGINTNDPHADLEVNYLLRLTPQNAEDDKNISPCNVDTEGSMYYNKIHHKFYGCTYTGTVYGWVPLH